MGLADWLRVARGHLTDEERAERDAAARRRREALERTEETRRAAEEQRASVRQQEADQVEQHRDRLRLCGGISEVILVCHPDTWQFVLQSMSFNVYALNAWTQDYNCGIAKQDDGLWQVHLSGPRLAEVLARLALVQEIDGRPSGYLGPHEVEVAKRIYQAVVTVVDEVQPGVRRTADSPPLIFLDDAVRTR